MTIEARVITHTASQFGPPKEAVTFVLKYPRFIHSEFLTHRMLSRNSASSRAIPVSKMLGMAISEPVYPIHWGQNQKGMQASQELSKSKQWIAKKVWRASCYTQVAYAWLLNKLGVHKQVTNRLIEPFSHMTVITTATDWGNFFNLRCHPAAQPEFQELAYKMLEAYVASKPTYIMSGDWHLPFADRYLAENLRTDQLLKITTARCARVSYLNFEGNIDHEKDYKLHDDLLKSGHMSPFEHALQLVWGEAYYGNFRGYRAYRYTLPRENRSEFNPEELFARRKSHGA